MSDILVSPLTAATLVVGVIIGIVYLRNMWVALQRTADTLDQPDDERPDAFAYSFLGAIVSVVASSLAIAAYGLGPIFLYVGIILALLSPIAVGYTFYRELQD